MRRADAQTGRKDAGYHLGKVPQLAPALLPKHHQRILSTVMFAYSVMKASTLEHWNETLVSCAFTESCTSSNVYFSNSFFFSSLYHSKSNTLIMHICGIIQAEPGSCIVRLTIATRTDWKGIWWRQLGNEEMPGDVRLPVVCLGS